MHIKNLDKIKELIKSKLPEYLNELGCRTNGTKVQCPHSEAHDNNDETKLSAAFLPDSKNHLIYCFVEQRSFDIFDVYGIKNNVSIKGSSFFEAVKALARKYSIPIEEEYEYSASEKAINRQRKFLENIHKLSIQKKNLHKGVPYYKQRNINKEKLQTWKIGCLSPNDITPELNKECKSLFDYRLLSVFHKEGLVIPILNENNQYSGLIIRMFNTEDNDPYIKICIKGSNLFNIERVRGHDELTIVEGPFDAIALHPNQNVIGCLTNVINDANLEKIANIEFKKIFLALDPDNLYKGTARDGFLRTVVRMKNLDSEIFIIKIPVIEGEAKPDPDEYMKTHTLDDFKDLPKLSALKYLIENYEKGLIKEKIIYDFIAGCPNLIRKEAYITECAESLKIGKRQLTKSIDDMSNSATSFNMIQYVQEKDAYDELLEDFTELAWNKNFAGIPSGFPLFDKRFGGFEDTLYLLAGFPETGKCHTKGTKILMYDGSSKSVENLNIDDILMGENSNPVTIKSVCKGKEETFNIIPNKGESFGVNKSHILVLSYNQLNQKTKKREYLTLELSVNAYLKKSKCFRDRCKLIRKSVEFKKQYVKYDPYFIGLWLGDGTKNQPEITGKDIELESYFIQFAEENKLIYKKLNRENRCSKHTFTNKWKNRNNPLLNELRLCVRDNIKRVPNNYLINSKENRLQLLAGLLDSDGYYSKGMFSITCKESELKDDILFLTRSLGLGSTYRVKKVKYVYKEKNEIREYFLINIFGEINKIPTKLKRKHARIRVSNKNALKTGFSVEALGVDDYYGFTLDKESKGRYLLGDFTLTHNTTFLLNFVYKLAMNDNTLVAFYSLDDGAKRAILPRLMSITSGLTSKQVRQPNKEIHDKWFNGMGQLKKMKDNIIIKDGSHIRTLDDLDNYVKIHSTIAMERGKKFVVVIDNLHDLQASGGKHLEATQNAQRVASYLKRLPQQINCPIISTAEVPKSSSAKPSGKDIKESIDLWYASRFVGGVYSNFHQVKNIQDSNLHWVDENGAYNPIMELFVSKNQTGDALHGSLFFKFRFANNTLTECNERETDILNDGGFLTFMND